MPHNRTRFWVGVAIAGITIPAVGTYFYGSTTGELRGTPISAAGRWNAVSQSTVPMDAGRILRRAPRDYQAEIDAALAKQGATIPTEPLPGSDDDPSFNIDPIDDSAMPSAEPAPRVLPDPAAEPASDAPTTVVASEVAAAVASQDAAVSVAATGDLSDGDVYRIVTSNLSAEDRDEFVRAYAAMTPDQRADLIDGFRDQMQGGR